MYRVAEVAEMCGLGVTKTYSLINRGLIRAVHVDGGEGASRHAIRVPAEAIDEFVAGLEAQEGHQPAA
jgi:excisionase family DNA binding protein